MASGVEAAEAVAVVVLMEIEGTTGAVVCVGEEDFGDEAPGFRDA